MLRPFCFWGIRKVDKGVSYLSLYPLVKKLSSRQGLKWTVLVFLLLVLPGILAPYHSDDYFQLLLLGNHSTLERHDGSLFGLFSFIDDVPAHRQQMQAYGVLPWFAAKDFSFRFWRPLAELTHWTDYRFFGVNPLSAHIHSVIWFLLLSAIVYQLARYTLPEKTTMPWLVFILFLWDGQHVANINWIANRNALLAASFSMLCLYAHMRWCDEKKILFLFVAVISWISALASGELALGGFSFLFFYAVMLDKSGPLQGFMRIIPYMLVLMAWYYLYRQMGFGVNTSAGLYVDPVAEPLDFLSAVLRRIPVYFAASLLPVPSGFSWITGLKYAWLSQAFLLLSVVVSIGFIVFYREKIRRNHVLAFWLFSSIGALLPVCSTMAQDRLALLQTVGMDVVLAMLIYPFIIGVVECARPEKWIAMSLVFIHVLLSPMHLFLGSVYMYWGANNILSNAMSFPENQWKDKNILAVRVPIGEAVALVGIREAMGQQKPKQFNWISNDEGVVKVTAMTNNRFLVEKSTGFANGFESAFRSVKKEPFKESEKIPLGEVEIIIKHINPEGYPDKIIIDLLQGEWLFYSYSDNHYFKVEMPRIGHSKIFN